MEVKKDRKFNTNIVCKLQSMIGNGQYVDFFLLYALINTLKKFNPRMKTWGNSKIFNKQCMPNNQRSRKGSSYKNWILT